MSLFKVYIHINLILALWQLEVCGVEHLVVCGLDVDLGGDGLLEREDGGAELSQPVPALLRPRVVHVELHQSIVHVLQRAAHQQVREHLEFFLRVLLRPAFLRHQTIQYM